MTINADYFITLNNQQSKNVPSDIQGLQRIEYRVIEKGDHSLHEQFQRHIVKQQTFVGKKLWTALREEDRPDALFTFAVRVVCHFRDKSLFKPKSVRDLSKGLRLRGPQRTLVMAALRREGFIKSKGTNYVRARDVFKPYKSA